MSIGRKKFTSSTTISNLEKFDKLSKETRLLKSALMDEALEDLFKKYEEKIKLYQK